MEQSTMNEAELTLLSLLAEAPRYGHELQTLIDDRGLREWVMIGFSSIFYLLSKLEKHGLIAAEARADHSGMPRKHYSLTESGRGVLQTAVADLLRQPHALGSGFELGLANLNVLKPVQVYRTLNHHRSDLRQRLTAIEQSYQRYQREDDDGVDAVDALYTHSLAVMKAEFTWLEAFLQDWLQRYPGVDKAANENDVVSKNPHRAVTVSTRRTTPDAAKLIQKLRRPPKPE
jgi:DNA-binding PadR family transcriptional regulator